MVRIINVCVMLHNMLIQMVECGDVVGQNEVDFISELLEEEEKLEIVGNEEGFIEDDTGSVGHDNLILDEENIMIQEHIVMRRTAFNELPEDLKIRPRHHY